MVRVEQPLQLELLGQWAADFPLALAGEGAPLHAPLVGECLPQLARSPACSSMFLLSMFNPGSLGLVSCEAAGCWLLAVRSSLGASLASSPTLGIL
jgi:hypothetical protein